MGEEIGGGKKNSARLKPYYRRPSLQCRTWVDGGVVFRRSVRGEDPSCALDIILVLVDPPPLRVR
jgi:hypothetical protein